MDDQIKIKLWYLFRVNKRQFLLIYLSLAFLSLAMAIYSFYSPYDATLAKNAFGRFYAHNAVSFWLFIVFYTIVEGLFFWNYFYKEQLKIIQKQNVELAKQKEEISSQKEEIESQMETVTIQKFKIEEQNKLITSSIRYARGIQNAVLPTKIELNTVFENFIIYLPRDIVSGDFYWFRTVKQLDSALNIIACADCTGHGVPGGFVSMLGISLLNEIVNVQQIYKPDLILNKLRDAIKTSLHQRGEMNEQQDGMDIAIVVVDKNANKFSYAGANSPIYLCSSEKFNVDNVENYRFYSENETYLIEFLPNKMPVGVYNEEKNFTSKNFELKKGNRIYMFSDGYIDQFGGEKNQKFMTRRFKKLILDTFEMQLNEQRQKILDNLIEWKEKRSQVDDILVMGIEF